MKLSFFHYTVGKSNWCKLTGAATTWILITSHICNASLFLTYMWGMKSLLVAFFWNFLPNLSFKAIPYKFSTGLRFFPSWGIVTIMFCFSELQSTPLHAMTFSKLALHLTDKTIVIDEYIEIDKARKNKGITANFPVKYSLYKTMFPAKNKIL